MPKLIILFSLLFLYQIGYAVQKSITSQADWNSIIGATPISSTDTITIEVSADIIIPGSAFTNNGTMNVKGTLTMTTPPSSFPFFMFTNSGTLNIVGEVMLWRSTFFNTGMVNGNGTLTIDNMSYFSNSNIVNIYGMMSVAGGSTFENYSTLNNAGIIKLYQSGFFENEEGTVNNTGTILLLDEESIFYNFGVVNTCAEITNNLSFDFPQFIAPAAPGLIGVICDDGDPNTENDVIISQDPACECAGTPIRPIPTLSQWGLITLSIIMLIFGLIGLKERKLIFE